MGQQCCSPELTEDDPQNENDVVRFFMVGTGGAGKTTVVRQLKCLCKDSPKDYKAFNPSWSPIERDDIFSRTEMSLFQRRIKANVVTAVANLIEQAHEWRYPISAAESANRIREAKDQSDMQASQGSVETEHPASTADDVVNLLNDEAIQKTLARSHEMSPEYRLEDGTLHFLNEEDIRRVFDESTVPSSSDIVHSRYPTTDIQDFRFGIKSMRIQIHDMGGQTSELIKLPEFVQQWIRGSEDGYRNFVLYVTSMADFNLIDENNRDFTALDRSIRTLDIILSMGAIQDCGVMIFFNKQDRFDHMCSEMLKTENGRKDILKYLGSGLDSKNKENVTKGTIELKKLHSAVANKFTKIVKARRKGEDCKGVYMRYTKAVDPKVMSTLFNAIQNEIINQVISNAEFIMV